MVFPRAGICYEVYEGLESEMDVRGVVHGDEIKLEKPLSELEGKKVLVRVEVVEDERDLSPDEQRRAWDEWVAHGPQGPIDDDPEWP